MKNYSLKYFGIIDNTLGILSKKVPFKYKKSRPLTCNKIIKNKKI